MIELTNHQRYECLLIDNHRDALENISAGNADLIAGMLAKHLCYAENDLRLECPEESQLALLRMVVEALQAPSKGLTTTLVLPFTPIHELATIAVTTYRACVKKALGGNQTPCISDEI
ncbi:hypothetical protein [Aeromonas popoffii]|uniref:hypothetical protein n=1 Tax=Aeromonas popoffii TaxID=70856 RepID=UPI0005A8782C|nr:hypothetical protein [Aeromonas popoffii]